MSTALPLCAWRVRLCPTTDLGSNLNCRLGVKRTHALSTITLSHFLFFSSIFSDAQQPAVLGQWLLA